MSTDEGREMRTRFRKPLICETYGDIELKILNVDFMIFMIQELEELKEDNKSKTTSDRLL